MHVAKSSIITISSHVAYGAVGNRIIVPALEALEIGVTALSTVQLPWHPGMNAAFGKGARIVPDNGAFAAMPDQRHQELIDLNVSGLTSMLAHFLPPMLARGHGRILNVASIAAFQPVPTLATYAATKAYVLSLTESLSEELKGTGV